MWNGCQGPPPSGLEVSFRADPKIGGGAGAANDWLLELPDPITRLSWGNAALMSPATARELGVEKEQVVVLSRGGRDVEAPVWILPGQPAGSITVHLGHGRWRAGRLGTARPDSGGFNAYPLRTSDALWSGRGLRVRPLGKRYPLASTQVHQLLDGPTRELLRVETLARYNMVAREPDAFIRDLLLAGPDSAVAAFAADRGRLRNPATILEAFADKL